MLLSLLMMCFLQDHSLATLRTNHDRDMHAINFVDHHLLSLSRGCVRWLTSSTILTTLSRLQAQLPRTIKAYPPDRSVRLSLSCRGKENHRLSAA